MFFNMSELTGTITKSEIARSSLNCECFVLLSKQRSAALLDGTQTPQWKLRRIDPKLGYAGQAICTTQCPAQPISEALEDRRAASGVIYTDANQVKQWTIVEYLCQLPVNVPEQTELN